CCARNDRVRGLFQQTANRDQDALSQAEQFSEVFNRACRQSLHQGICILLSMLAKGELMTSEMIRKSYKAIRCFYCSETIPISTRLLEHCVVDSDSTTAEL